jgi:hypothetical protein
LSLLKNHPQPERYLLYFVLSFSWFLLY